jgi:hypothetical protein
MSIAQDLATRRNLINQALEDPNILDKRYLWAQLEQIGSIDGSSSPGGVSGPSGKGIADLVIVDSGRSPRYFVRQDTIDSNGTIVTKLVNLDGTTPSSPPVPPLIPIANSKIEELLGSINNKTRPTPQRVQLNIDSNTAYPIEPDLDSIQILGLSIVFTSPKVCKLHLINNVQVIGIFNFRPIQSSGKCAHILMPDRSIALPTWIPLNTSLYNPEDIPILTYLTYSKIL